MLILGLNAYHGDASACLLVDGQLVAAAEEERFVRVKHWAGFPRLAVDYCLQSVGAKIEDVDHIAIGRNPRANLKEKVLYSLKKRPDFSFILDRVKNQMLWVNPKAQLAMNLGCDPSRIRATQHHVEHHIAHMASAYYPSGFDDAACVSIDGAGDFSTTMWGRGVGGKLEPLRRVPFPHSLGIMYSGLSQYLGFPKFGDEYKVMGLSAYGQPELLNKLRQVVRVRDGAFELGLEYFRHHSKGISMTWEGEPRYDQIYSDALAGLLGPAREPKSAMTDQYKAVAASVQAVFEEAYLEILETARKLTGSKRLALAGGCAHNSLAAGRIRPKGLFEEVFIQPAAGDAGTSLGAAFYTYHHTLGYPRKFKMNTAYWGPSSTQADIEALLKTENIPFETLSEEEIVARTAKTISDGNVVGWFQGRMEWGPRALGNRSILVDPRRADMQDLMNARIKKREMFRPFAPALPLEEVGNYFDQTYPDPFMTMVYNIIPEKRKTIPAVTHVDGTGRLQTVTSTENPRYYALIKKFGEMTGVPVLLNTSFNENEPVVCTPKEALDCFLRTKMDVLVLERTFIDKKRVNEVRGATVEDMIKPE